MTEHLMPDRELQYTGEVSGFCLRLTWQLRWQSQQGGSESGSFTGRAETCWQSGTVMQRALWVADASPPSHPYGACHKHPIQTKPPEPAPCLEFSHISPHPGCVCKSKGKKT